MGRITIKESLSFYDDDDVDDVEKTVLNLELNQFEQELEFFNQTYGWNVEYKEREIMHINNAEEHDQEENNNDIINNNVNDIGDNNDNKKNDEIIIKKKKTKNEIIEEKISLLFSS